MYRALFLSLLLPWLALGDVDFIDYESDHSALKVVLPASLKTFAGQDGIRHSQALFGSPSYGGDKKITGELFYVTPDAMTGCMDFSENVPKNVDKGTHMVFLVDRGACDFVQKMKLAQANGAVAVIIADTICQCSEMENAQLWSSTSTRGRTPEQKAKCDELALLAKKDGRILPFDNCERGLPYMADDGSGFDVRIPSFLIDNIDAQPLKYCIDTASGRLGLTDTLLSGESFRCPINTKLVVSLEWDLPPHDNIVDWQLWSSSDSEAVFKKAFTTTAKKLQAQTKFTPHYFIWDGVKWGCNVADICATQCTHGGLYCNPDPDHNLFSGVSGRDVVEENLRELCVWDQAVAKNKTGLWWDYVSAFANACHPGSVPTAEKFNPSCSENAQRSVGLDPVKTNACVRDSWKGDINAKLDKEIALRANLKILTLPTAIVNDVLLRGGVTPLSILSSICSGYKDGFQPNICVCVDRATSDNLLQCINSDCPPDQKLCSKDKKCYSIADYGVWCSDACPSGQAFCSTIGQCLNADQKCPQCTSLNEPTYCAILGKCVDSYASCVPPPSPSPADQGTSAFGVFVITVMVVSIAACGAYMFWRRQKARLHDDVRAILSSYMALEESDDNNERVSRQLRRVESPSTSNTASAGAVGGQDAATYI